VDGDIAVVPLTVRGGHQYAEILVNQFLRPFVAKHVQHGLVDRQDSSVRASDNETVRRGIDQRAELCFALAQFRLRLTQRGHIGQGFHDEATTSVSVIMHRLVSHDDYLRAVLAAVTQFAVPRASAQQRGIDIREGHGKDRLEQLVRRTADGLLGGPAYRRRQPSDPKWMVPSTSLNMTAATFTIANNRRRSAVSTAMHCVVALVINAQANRMPTTRDPPTPRMVNTIKTRVDCRCSCCA
jgi:hypothetical protein